MIRPWKSPPGTSSSCSSRDRRDPGRRGKVPEDRSNLRSAPRQSLKARILLRLRGATTGAYEMTHLMLTSALLFALLAVVAIAIGASLGIARDLMLDENHET